MNELINENRQRGQNNVEQGAEQVAENSGFGDFQGFM